ncbi:MAG: aspartate kinase [Limnochordia bacterium]|jgi:aspartate kinase
MRIVVQKFGGTSVADAQVRQHAVARVISALEMGYTPVVVVSAMGKAGQPYATDSLLELVHEVNPEPNRRNVDLLLSCGEIISAVIFAEQLSIAGHPAEALTGWQCGILTDAAFTQARIQEVNPERVLALLEQGIIPVVAGFQGISASQEITTLGRGGSDTTAAALGVVLKAEWVGIYTDVDGIKTADPRLVPEARTLPAVSGREVVELAHLGAKVIHPRAAEIALEEGVPLRILSTVDDTGGTLVANGISAVTGRGGEPVGDRVVVGIAHMTNRAQVTITGEGDMNRAAAAPRVFDSLAQHGVSVDLIFLSTDMIAFTIDSSMASLARQVLTTLGLRVRIEEGFAKVSVVGAGMHGVPGVMARVVNCLERENIPIFQTTDSHANISCLIREEQITQAVRALHREFNLDRSA